MKRIALIAAIVCTSAVAQDLGNDSILRWSLQANAIGSTFPLAVMSDIPPIFDTAQNGMSSGTVPTSLSSFGSMSLALSCNGEDGLTCSTGGAFAEAGSGASPSTGQPVPFSLSTARGVKIASAGMHLAASDTAVADVTAGDLAVEAIFEAVYDGAGRDVIVSKRDDGGTNNGWELALTSSTAVTLTIDAGASSQTASCTVQANAAQHVLCFTDRDDASGMRCACNGSLGTATNPTAAAGSLTTTDPVRIGGDGSAGGQMTGTIARIRVWVGSGLAIASYQTQASDHVARSWGLYPSVATGTALPTTATRATTKVCDIDRDGDGTRRLFTLGNNLPCISRRRERTTSTYRVGLLAEAQVSNLWDFSDAATDASWTKTNVGATDGTATPLVGDTSGDALESTDAAGSVEHYVRQAATLTVTTWTFSCFGKIGADTATHFWLRNNTIANGAAWFNGSTCAAGTTQAGVITAHGASYGDGWCRLGISFTGTAAAHDLDFGYSNADAVGAYDDGTDATTDATVWRCQVEVAQVPTAPILTTSTSSVQRNADDWRYDAPNNMTTSGTLSVDFICPSYDNTGAGNLLSMRIDSSNFLVMYVNANNDVARVESFLGGVAQIGITGLSGDITDGNHHNFRLLYETDNVIAMVDGTAINSADTSATMFSSLTGGALWLGQNNGSHAQCLITRVRAWDSRVSR